jgi:predicted nucleic acid-binding protein
VTVVDTSVVVDYLLGGGVGSEVEALLREEGELAAPDILVFETLAVLRRHTLAGQLEPLRAAAAIEDLADLPIELFESMALGVRAFQLRDNFTVADGLFAALAEMLREPLLTKDAALARAVETHCDAAVRSLSDG